MAQNNSKWAFGLVGLVYVFALLTARFDSPNSEKLEEDSMKSNVNYSLNPIEQSSPKKKSKIHRFFIKTKQLSGYSLNDAMTHHRWLSDMIQKFTTYFQVVSVGVIAVAWSEAGKNKNLVIALLICFPFFALGNIYIVFDLQGQAQSAKNAIHAYKDKHLPKISEELRPLIETVDSYTKKAVVIALVVMLFIVEIVVAFRLC